MDIPDPLFRLAKQRAVEEGVPLREIVARALRLQLGGPLKPAYHFRWRVEKGRLLRGVDVNDRQALYDVLDRRA